MPIKNEELEETTGPINILGLMQDGMAYSFVELYELLYEKSIDFGQSDDEKGGSRSEEMGVILSNLSLVTLDLSRLSYKLYREFEKGTLGEGTKDGFLYYYKRARAAHP